MTNVVPYKKGYYFTDRIYPEWSVLVKSISQSSVNGMKQIRYKEMYEGARKDVE